MTTLVMPRVSGSRLSARSLAEQLPVECLKEETVILDASPMEAASQSYADELVLRILACERASRFEVHGATARFAKHLVNSARVRSVEDRLNVTVRRTS